MRQAQTDSITLVKNDIFTSKKQTPPLSIFCQNSLIPPPQKKNNLDVKSAIYSKNHIFEVKYLFRCKNRLFIEYSTGVEILILEFSEKCLMIVDIHNNYLEMPFITYENIQKRIRTVLSNLVAQKSILGKLETAIKTLTRLPKILW